MNKPAVFFKCLPWCAVCETYGPRCKQRMSCSPERMTQECYVWGFGGPNRKKSKWGTMIPHLFVSTCCQDMTHDKNNQNTDIIGQDDITKGHVRTKLTENNIFAPECFRMLQDALDMCETYGTSMQTEGANRSKWLKTAMWGIWKSK